MNKSIQGHFQICISVPLSKPKGGLILARTTWVISVIDCSAIMRKDYMILHTVLMKGFEFKQTVGKLKTSCKINSNEFLKIFSNVRSSSKKKILRKTKTYWWDWSLCYQRQ